MPGFNKTGPLGQGPLTGRGQGLCGGGGGFNTGFGGGRAGRGQRMGRGFRAFGFSSFQAPNNQEVISHLKQQKQWIEEEITRREQEENN